MKFLERGCPVGLGTDGTPDMIRFMESAIIDIAIRLNYHSEGSVPRTQKLLELATLDAARVIGMADEMGSLEPGKKADVIIVDMKKPHMVPNVDPAANLVYIGSGNDVKTVIIDGRIVMEDEVVKTLNESEMPQRTQDAAENLWTRYYSDS